MTTLWTTLRDVLMLRTQAFLTFRDDPDGLRRGVTWLMVITLIAGALTFVVDLTQSLQPLETRLADVERGVEEAFAQMERFLPPGQMPPGFREQFRSNFRAGLRIGAEVEALPTLLPKPLGALFEAMGSWLSRPFARLGGWLGYALWVMLAARLLGGTGGLRGFLATTSLYAIPQLLAFFNPVPCLGALLNLVAAVWGWAIYVKATAVAHGWVSFVETSEGATIEYTDWGRAIVAVLLPLLVAGMLALLVVVVLILVAVLS